MGRRSVKSDKNIYQQLREDCNLTREKASELMSGISDDRIEKIENGKTLIHPDEVLQFAKAYNSPELAINYCALECPIGQKYVHEVKPQELSGTVLEILDSINNLNAYKEKLITITADGIITEDERPDLDAICEELDRISTASDMLKIWIEKKMSGM